MTNQKYIQIGAVAVAVLLTAFLFSQPIKGLVTKEETTTETKSNSAYSLEQVSAVAKQTINASIASDITNLEKKANSAKGNERLAILKELAEKWGDVAKYAPQAYVLEEIALVADSKFDFWLQAGDAYRQAYTNLQDTTFASELNQKALNAYEQAMSLNGNSLEAKTGLGAAMVTGTNNPMAGIALLQEVVKVEPRNLQANKTLGLFSMQSRQFDRAIDRFKTVIEIQPDAESYFYLATSYENIGLKNEAITAFQQSKSLAADPTLSQFIDKRIEELSK